MSFNLLQTFVNPFLISDYFPGFAIRVLVEIHIESVDWSGSVWLNMGFTVLFLMYKTLDRTVSTRGIQYEIPGTILIHFPYMKI
jgi:hypothetical protein